MALGHRGCVRVSFLLAIISVLAVSCSSSKVSPTCRDLNKDISNTVSTLVKLLDYFQKHANQLNVDGLSGIEFGNGFVIQEIEAIKAVKSNSGLLEMLKILKQRINSIVSKAVKSVERATPQYLSHFWKVTVLPQIYSNKSEELGHCHDWTRKLKKFETSYEYREKKGDLCFSNVLGTATKKQRKCKSTKRCWRRMVIRSFVSGGYTRTHGVLYLMMMKKFGCKASKGFQLQNLIRDFCCLIKKEFAKSLERDLSTLTNGDDDLLAEQAVACTAAGYRGFYSDRLYRHYASRQTDSGCFGAPLFPKFRRRLLFSSTMADGCSSHMSGLVAAFLSFRLQYQLEKFRRSCLG